eukprot:2015840-Prymnesium_polylepis.1
MELLRQLVGGAHPNAVLIDTLIKYDNDDTEETTQAFIGGFCLRGWMEYIPKDHVIQPFASSSHA